jgi:CubicO group peptidase (beta-lactamase class C family)
MIRWNRAFARVGEEPRQPGDAAFSRRNDPVISPPFRVAIAAVLPVALSCCARPAPPPVEHSDVAGQVDARVATYLRETHAPGLSVAVVRAGRDTLVFHGYGLADVEDGVRATPETVFPIASVTKQFTAAAVMRLAQEGRLSLGDTLGMHLPGLPAAWRGLRVSQLLNHTSGIPTHPVLLAEGVSPDSVVARAAKEPLEFAAGTQWSYSNVGYRVLGLMIEKVSGRSYAAYLESRIFRPAGMTATHFCETNPPKGRRAVGYLARDTGVAVAPLTNMRFVFASGGLCSTVGDMAAWNHALARGRVVTPASLARMTDPEGAARASGYGYGLIVQRIDEHRVFGHGGELEGFRSSNAYLPDDSLSVTVLTNLGSASATPLLLDIVRISLAAARPRGSAGAPKAGP